MKHMITTLRVYINLLLVTVKYLNRSLQTAPRALYAQKFRVVMMTALLFGFFSIAGAQEDMDDSIPQDNEQIAATDWKTILPDTLYGNISITYTSEINGSDINTIIKTTENQTVNVDGLMLVKAAPLTRKLFPRRAIGKRLFYGAGTGPTWTSSGDGHKNLKLVHSEECQSGYNITDTIYSINDEFSGNSEISLEIDFSLRTAKIQITTPSTTRNENGTETYTPCHGSTTEKPYSNTTELGQETFFGNGKITWSGSQSSFVVELNLETKSQIGFGDNNISNQTKITGTLSGN